MAASIQKSKPTEDQSLFPISMLETQERNAALLTRAAEVMVGTARAVWESQTELFRLETEQAAKALEPLKFGTDPSATVAAYCSQWREGSEKAIAHVRTVGDLFRKCGWDLFHIYEDTVRESLKPAEPLSH